MLLVLLPLFLVDLRQPHELHAAASTLEGAALDWRPHSSPFRELAVIAHHDEVGDGAFELEALVLLLLDDHSALLLLLVREVCGLELVPEEAARGVLGERLVLEGPRPHVPFCAAAGEAACGSAYVVVLDCFLRGWWGARRPILRADFIV